MRFLLSILTIFAAPLMLLNTLGGTVSGIWLAFLGDWSLIWNGLLISIPGGFVLGLVVGLSLPLAFIGVNRIEKGKYAQGALCLILNSIWTVAVLVFWATTVMFYCFSVAESTQALPIMLWVYGIINAPVLWLSQKDAQSGNPNGMIMAFFINVASVISLALVYFFEIYQIEVAIIYAAVLALGQCLQLALACYEEKHRGL